MTLVQKATKRLSKQIAKNRDILDAAYELFLERGFDSVSIKDIAERAGIAKGTFYLYYSSKEDLRESLITQKSNELFRRALDALSRTDIPDFSEQIIFMVDYVTDTLAQNKKALMLIEKDLSFGLFNQKLEEIFADQHPSVLEILTAAAEKSGVKLRNPEVLLYMVVELVGSTCFSCILNAQPFELAVYKPYLFDAIRQLIVSQSTSISSREAST